MPKAILVAALVCFLGGGSAERVIYETDSLYHHIVVSEDSKLRYLRFHKGPAEQALGLNFAQSIIRINDPYALHMGYARASMAAAALAEEPSRVLFIGLGAGTLPKFYARLYPECAVDVVELDEKVVEVARRYFFFPEADNMTVTVMDGRRFLRKTDKRYDIIFLDAYRDQMIPFHMMTAEFFKEVSQKLTDGGILVSNVAVRDRAQLYPWLLRTYQSSFGTVLVGRVAGTINKVIIAAPEPDAFSTRDVLRASRELGRRHDFDFDIVGAARAYTDESIDRQTDRILTDNYAPVNLMKVREADEKDWRY